jgi:hypothetical protein
MPITITPNIPHGTIGPGLAIEWSSDLPSSELNASRVVIQCFTPGTFPIPGWFEDQPASGTGGRVTLGANTETTGTVDPQAQFRTDDQVETNVSIQDSTGTTTDTGQMTIPWDAESGLGTLITFRSGTGSSTGLTPEQSLQLSQTWDSTFPSVLLDALLLEPLAATPNGGPQNSNLASWIWGVIVRIADVPTDLIPATPDGDYWFESLAVVRIFRGADLWKRVPIHTSSKMVSLADDNVSAAIAAIPAGQWLAQMSVQVTFRPGVTGLAYLMKQP